MRARSQRGAWLSAYLDSAIPCRTTIKPGGFTLIPERMGSRAKRDLFPVAPRREATATRAASRGPREAKRRPPLVPEKKSLPEKDKSHYRSRDRQY